MDKIIAEQLEFHFKDYKNQMLWILLVFFIITLVVQFISNLVLSRKIEKFKNELKKTEIKFSKHSELQIECLKNMYNKVVDLHFTFTALINPTFYTHESLQVNINNLSIVYNDNMNFFIEIKYYLPMI